LDLGDQWLELMLYVSFKIGTLYSGIDKVHLFKDQIVDIFTTPLPLPLFEGCPRSLNLLDTS
jgi:hypothetical protein